MLSLLESSTQEKTNERMKKVIFSLEKSNHLPWKVFFFFNGKTDGKAKKLNERKFFAGGIGRKTDIRVLVGVPPIEENQNRKIGKSF